MKGCFVVVEPWVILVAGGRDFTDIDMAEFAMAAAMRHLTTADPSRGFKFIQGGAKGADFLCKCLALKYGYDVDEYPADWNTHGRAAGHIRNQQMLDEGRPNVAIILPGGRGTDDMFTKASAAGLHVYDLRKGMN